jgi:hypothetical protein
MKDHPLGDEPVAHVGDLDGRVGNLRPVGLAECHVDHGDDVLIVSQHVMDGDVSIDPPDRTAHLTEDRLSPEDLGVAGFVPAHARSQGTLHGVDVAGLERRGPASPLALAAPRLRPANRAVNGGAVASGSTRDFLAVDPAGRSSMI